MPEALAAVVCASSKRRCASNAITESLEWNIGLFGKESPSNKSRLLSWMTWGQAAGLGHKKSLNAPQRYCAGLMGRRCYERSRSGIQSLGDTEAPVGQRDAAEAGACPPSLGQRQPACGQEGYENICCLCCERGRRRPRNPLSFP